MLHDDGNMWLFFADSVMNGRHRRPAMEHAVKVPLARMFIDDEMRSAVLDVLNSGNWIKGQRSRDFAAEFTSRCQAKGGVTCSNGSVALIAALRLLGVGHGDEVIVPSHTYIASATAANHVGATPIFVEVNNDHTANQDSIKNAITENTKAAILVHLYGQPVSQEAMDVVRDAGIPLIEDCAQAHGATLNGEPIGSFGDFATFSFFPSKNMGVGGDGGMILTNRDDLIENMKMIVDHGRSSKYENIMLGTNWRMSEMLAAVGLVQLKHLDHWVQGRREIAEIYSEELSDLDWLETPIIRSEIEHAWHQYVVQVDDRDEFMSHLESCGVASGIHYPIPCHRQPVYNNHVQHKIGALPITERICARIVSLPIHPLHSKEETQRVVAAVRSYR